MKKKYEPLDKYKIDINLAEFMILHGFYETKKKSTKNQPRLKDPITDFVYVVKRNDKGHYTYWSPDYEIAPNNDKSPTIIDFVEERYNEPGQRKLTLGHVRKILDKYMNSKNYIPPKKSKYNIPVGEKINPGIINTQYNQLLNFTDRTFLHNRKIKDKIIDHPYFKPIIKNKKYVDDTRNETYINTVFTMADHERIKAISIKNEKFSGCIGNKASSFCASYNRSRNLDQLYLTESMIDGMSHFQLNFEKLKNKSVRYLSSEGTLTNEQIHLLSKSINIQKPKELILINDNDLSGKIFNLKTICQLDNNIIPLSDKPFLNSAKIDLHRTDKYNCYLDISFSHKNKVFGIQNIALLSEYVNNLNKTFSNYTVEGKPFELHINKISDTLSNARIYFPAKNLHLDELFNFIHKYRYNEHSFFKIEVPKLKDFNDDLKNINTNSKKEILR